jgi:lysophospholipase L1-like esterase
MDNSFKLSAGVEDVLKVFFENSRKQRLANFLMLNRLAEKNAIVLLGDSIMEGFPILELYRSQTPIYNRGVAGDTTHNVMNRLQESIFDLQPAKVFLLIGTNDLEQEKDGSVEEIADRIEKICVSIHTNLPTTRIYLLSVFPVNPSNRLTLMGQSMVGSRNNGAIQALNALLRQAASRLGIPYIEIFPLLTDQEGNLQIEYTNDGLHLNVDGYYVVLSVLVEYLS